MRKKTSHYSLTRNVWSKSDHFLTSFFF